MNHQLLLSHTIDISLILYTYLFVIAFFCKLALQAIHCGRRYPENGLLTRLHFLNANISQARPSLMPQLIGYFVGPIFCVPRLL